jgi:hypothetical protein
VSEHRARIAYRTGLGVAYQSTIEDFLRSSRSSPHTGNIKLVLTSPPFPLLKKKRYGNYQGQEYLEWIADIFSGVANLLAPDGSIVLEIGNAWDPGQPSMSTLPLRALLEVTEKTGLSICQQFVCYNPARLPGPAQWVTVKRYRVKDAYTHVWWLAKDPWLIADNRRVAQPYSDGMKKLLERGHYNSGIRPSEHRINPDTFLRNNGGAIPSNVLTYANTSDSRDYTDWCRTHGIRVHPARMPAGLARFFVDFLTDPGDLVFDPFGGSNVVGAVAEESQRRWLTVERESQYLLGSMGRFERRNNRFSARNLPYRDLVGSVPN